MAFGLKDLVENTPDRADLRTACSWRWDNRHLSVMQRDPDKPPVAGLSHLELQMLALLPVHPASSIGLMRSPQIVAVPAMRPKMSMPSSIGDRLVLVRL